MKAEVIREIARAEAERSADHRGSPSALPTWKLQRFNSRNVYIQVTLDELACDLTEALRILEQAGFVVLPKEELEAALKIVSAAEWIWRANDAHTNRIALRGAEASSRDECNTALANLVTEYTADDFHRAAALLAAITQETKS